MPMKDDDQADYADWVLEVKLGRTRLGFDDWRVERDAAELEAAQDALERVAERRAERRGEEPIQHRIWRHSGKRID